MSESSDLVIDTQESIGVEELGESPTPETTDTPEQQPPAEPPEPKGVAKRLKELTDQKHEERDLRIRAQQEADFLRQQLLQAQQRPPETPTPVVPQGPPNLADFQDFAEFTRATARYETEQQFKQWQTNLDQQRERDAQAQRTRTFQEKISAFAGTVPDFRETVFTDQVSISDAVLQAVTTMDRGPEVLYYLGKNRDEAARLSMLDPVSAAVEIGRLSAQIAPKPKVTGAPPPIDPLSGGTGTGMIDPYNEPNGEKWLKWRNAQLQKNRK
jgi:hypothetical protein